MNVSFTMNQASIVERYGIGFGGDWTVSFSPLGEYPLAAKSEAGR